MLWRERPSTLVIPALNGGARQIQLPAQDPDEIEPREAAHAFSRASGAIAGEWSIRSRMADPNMHHAWLRRVAYELLSFYFDFGFKNVIENRIASAGSYPKGRQKSVNLFQEGLLAIFGSTSDAPDANVRRTVGKQLWHAYRHFVPPEFLEGFLLQIGTRRIGAQSDANAIETGFEKWISDCLKDEDWPAGLRPPYPRLIRKMAARSRGWD
jgi:hypothetical protein